MIIDQQCRGNDQTVLMYQQLQKKIILKGFVFYLSVWPLPWTYFTTTKDLRHLFMRMQTRTEFAQNGKLEDLRIVFYDMPHDAPQHYFLKLLNLFSQYFAYDPGSSTGLGQYDWWSFCTESFPYPNLTVYCGENFFRQNILCKVSFPPGSLVSLSGQY